MDLKDKQARLTVLGLNIEGLTAQYNKLKQEIIREMNSETKGIPDERKKKVQPQG